MYRESMGKVVAARSYLRSTGSTEYLDTKGMFKTTLTSASGATKRTWVYVVEGARTKALLGDHDAEDLGIVSLNSEGRTPKEEQEGENNEDDNNLSNPDMLRQEGRQAITERPLLHMLKTKGKEEAREGQEGKNCEDGNNLSTPDILRQEGREVIIERPLLHKVKTKGKEEANRIVSRYKGPVFTDRVGRMEDEAGRHRYEEGLKPVHPARYPEPYHYQESLEVHLKK